ncbi:MAG: hypothetical protein AAGH87_04505 [Pseudomonadota bacterium]
MKRRLICLSLLAAGAGAGPALAHHHSEPALIEAPLVWIAALATLAAVAIAIWGAGQTTRVLARRRTAQGAKAARRG